MESISKSTTRSNLVVKSAKMHVLLADAAVPLYYLRVGRIEGLRDMFYALEYEPYKKGILCCTFADISLYTFRKNDDYNRG